MVGHEVESHIAAATRHLEGPAPRADACARLFVGPAVLADLLDPVGVAAGGGSQPLDDRPHELCGARVHPQVCLGAAHRRVRCAAPWRVAGAPARLDAFCADRRRRRAHGARVRRAGPEPRLELRVRVPDRVRRGKSGRRDRRMADRRRADRAPGYDVGVVPARLSPGAAVRGGRRALHRRFRELARRLSYDVGADFHRNRRLPPVAAARPSQGREGRARRFVRGVVCRAADRPSASLRRSADRDPRAGGDLSAPGFRFRRHGHAALYRSWLHQVRHRHRLQALRRMDRHCGRVRRRRRGCAAGAHALAHRRRRRRLFVAPDPRLARGARREPALADAFGQRRELCLGLRRSGADRLHVFARFAIVCREPIRAPFVALRIAQQAHWRPFRGDGRRVRVRSSVRRDRRHRHSCGRAEPDGMADAGARGRGAPARE